MEYFLQEIFSPFEKKLCFNIFSRLYPIWMQEKKSHRFFDLHPHFLSVVLYYVFSG